MLRRIAVLSGPIGSGKTTTCRYLVELARQRGLDCAGVISPARFKGGVKVGIDALDVRTGQSRPLAEADDSPADLCTARYRFDADAMAWGVTILDTACPCDVLLVDELGPLELERGQGWVNALDVLRASQFTQGIVVVRPALLDAFARAVKGVPSQVFVLPLAPGMDLSSLLTMQVVTLKNVR